MENCKVFFFKNVFPDLAGQLRRGLGISCQHHDTTDYPVQPVNRSHIGFGVSQRLPD